MDIGNWGGLLPLWIIGAPFIVGLIELMRLPSAPRHRSPVHQPA